MKTRILFLLMSATVFLQCKQMTPIEDGSELLATSEDATEACWEFFGQSYFFDERGEQVERIMPEVLQNHTFSLGNTCVIRTTRAVNLGTWFDQMVDTFALLYALQYAPNVLRNATVNNVAGGDDFNPALSQTRVETYDEVTFDDGRSYAYSPVTVGETYFEPVIHPKGTHVVAFYITFTTGEPSVSERPVCNVTHATNPNKDLRTSSCRFPQLGILLVFDGQMFDSMKNPERDTLASYQEIYRTQTQVKKTAAKWDRWYSALELIKYDEDYQGWAAYPESEKRVFQERWRAYLLGAAVEALEDHDETFGQILKRMSKAMQRMDLNMGIIKDYMADMTTQMEGIAKNMNNMSIQLERMQMTMSQLCKSVDLMSDDTRIMGSVAQNPSQMFNPVNWFMNLFGGGLDSAVPHAQNYNIAPPDPNQYPPPFWDPTKNP